MDVCVCVCVCVCKLYDLMRAKCFSLGILTTFVVVTYFQKMTML